MTDFFITNEEAEYLEFILLEDLDMGSEKTDFIVELLEAIKRKERLNFEPSPRDAKVIPFPNRYEITGRKC